MMVSTGARGADRMLLLAVVSVTISKFDKRWKAYLTVYCCCCPLAGKGLRLLTTQKALDVAAAEAEGGSTKSEGKRAHHSHELKLAQVGLLTRVGAGWRWVWGREGAKLEGKRAHHSHELKLAQVTRGGKRATGGGGGGAKRSAA